MGSIDLMRNLKLKIVELNHIGLTVVGTVCDQASTNVSCIKKLTGETSRNFAVRGEEDKMSGFSVVEKEEIIPLYDTPHLLKGVRNNFLENGVVFQWKKGPQGA